MAEISFTFSCPGCCGGVVGWQVQCRSRSGTATLCGFTEFASPSVPPKAYRRKAFGGSNTFEGILEADCSTKVCGGTVSIGGSEDYEVCGAVPVNNTTFSGSNFPPESGCNTTAPMTSPSVNWAYGLCLAFCASGVPTITTSTKTRQTFSINDPGNCSNSPGDQTYAQLENEDTEEAAMDRLAPAWGPWTTGVCCTSKGMRGPGELSFGFSESEYRIRVKGGPGQLVTLYFWFTEDGVEDEFYEVRQFTATGAEYGDWQDFRIAASPGRSRCLTRITLYNP